MTELASVAFLLSLIAGIGSMALAFVFFMGQQYEAMVLAGIFALYNVLMAILSKLPYPSK